MRLIFMGTPDFAVPTLNALVAAGHDVCAIYSQPPRPANRGKRLTPSAVQIRAEELGLEVRTPLSLKNAEAQAEFAALDADIAVVAAYGLILPQAILDAPKLGCINIHASLLPRWRGAAPIQRAILAGDVETGVMLMQMEVGLDTGPILAEAKTHIENANAGQLTERLARMGASLLLDFLQLAEIAKVGGVDQPVHRVEPIYATKIEKPETRIDFFASAEQVERQIRAFSPLPGAWFESEGERFKVLKAHVEDVAGEPAMVIDDQLTIACATGAIRPTVIQRAGKPAMPVADFLRGKTIPVGTILK